jgi:GNAT superfamily N-acetyltransferase
MLDEECFVCVAVKAVLPRVHPGLPEKLVEAARQDIPLASTAVDSFYDSIHQGKGWAGVLLRPVLAALDAVETACCLETQNPRNVPLYEHFGFNVKLHTRVPGTDVGHW